VLWGGRPWPLFFVGEIPQRKSRLKNAVFEGWIETKIVHSAQKILSFEIKNRPFSRQCSLFGDSRDFIEKNVANFVDSHVRGGV
jgi:hypothetical protein